MLVWHSKLWLIDHGAALYFHHTGGDYAARARDPFTRIDQHVLLPWADALSAADAALVAQLEPSALRRIVALAPAAWLAPGQSCAAAAKRRDAYSRYFEERLRSPRAFVEEAMRARSRAV